MDEVSQVKPQGMVAAFCIVRVVAQAPSHITLACGSMVGITFPTLDEMTVVTVLPFELMMVEAEVESTSIGPAKRRGTTTK